MSSFKEWIGAQELRGVSMGLDDPSLDDRTAALSRRQRGVEHVPRPGIRRLRQRLGQRRPGAAFFGAYTDPAADTLGCAQQVPVQLTALSTAMTDTADTYLGTELANTDLAGGATTA